MSSIETLKEQLRKLTDEIEELQIKVHVHQEDMRLRKRLEDLLGRRAKLLAQMPFEPPEEAVAPQPQKAPPPLTCLQRFTRSNFAAVLLSSSNGFVTIAIYFADVISDVQVMLRLFAAGDFIWATEAAALLIGQYLAVYLRVLPYLRDTFGADSLHFRLFRVLGFPFGVLLLDLLMFLEPFGLLAVLPLPLWLKQFIPAYKATRIIAEVSLESLPQCTLQSYILVAVERRVRDGTASSADARTVAFAELLPRSIAISTLAMLKIWVELVQTSRDAGMSVRGRFVQLWHVGAGLPLDALRKGAIQEWACARELEASEVKPLLTALAKNSSLRRLSLAQAGLKWDGPGETSGAPLVEAIAAGPAALAALHELILDASTRFVIPLDAVRVRGGTALVALSSMPFLEEGGPQRTEILFIADVLRINRRPEVVTRAEMDTGEKAVALVERAHNGSLQRDEWERQLKLLMAEGTLRRAQLQSLLSLDVLREVGFTVAQLQAGAKATLHELKHDARFTAAELKAAGVELPELHALGYAVRELREAESPAAELRELGVSAALMRGGGYGAAELLAVGYPLGELTRAKYPPKELKLAGCTAAELHEVGLTAAEVRKADYKADELRSAGYTASELVAAFTAKELTNLGFTPSQLRAAGVTARELRQAGGTTIKVLKEAGYSIGEMKEGGVKAKDLEKLGYTLKELYKGGYGAKELREHGYEWHELVIECRCTYDELLEAGFEAGKKGAHGNDMAPTHQLFRQYAPSPSVVRTASPEPVVVVNLNEAT